MIYRINRIVAAIAAVMVIIATFLLFRSAGHGTGAYVYGGLLDVVAVGLIAYLLLQHTVGVNAKANAVVSEEKKDTVTETESSQAENEAAAKQFAEKLREQLAKISSAEKACDTILQQVAKACNAGQAALFTAQYTDGKRKLVFIAGYAYSLPDSTRLEFEFGEGLTGQAAKDQQRFLLSGVRSENATIFSGLGKAVAEHLLVQPIVEGDNTTGVIEISSFSPLSTAHQALIQQVLPMLNERLRTIKL